MRWLRENGRYLAPTGSNDYLFALAVGIRNFLALHYVIAVSLVTIFLLFAAARVFGFAYGFDSWFGEVEARFLPDPGANFWPSAWWILPIASLALIVVPVGMPDPSTGALAEICVVSVNPVSVGEPLVRVTDCTIVVLVINVE